MLPRKLSARTADRLQNEICHQMLRLEAGRPSAQLLLGVALIKAWMILGEQPADCEARQWLRRLTPVCLRMIEATGRDGHDDSVRPSPGNAGSRNR